MWPKKARITIADFPKNADTIFRGRYFVVKIARNKTKRNRYGAIVSARSEPSAVRRHYIKRQFDAASKKIKDSGRDLLLVGLPTLASADKESIKKEMLHFRNSLTP